MTIRWPSFAESMRDPNLLGASFQGASWESWHTLAKIISGEPLSAADMALVKECTGRSVLPTKPRRLFLLCGRRSGKSRFMSALGVWTAALAANWKRAMSPGETAICMLMACDRKQARILAEYCSGLIDDAPLLRSQVKHRTSDRTEFRNGSALEIMTNDSRTVRGRSAVALLGDECAFWRADGESASSDVEVFGAVMPSLLTAPGGGLVTLSSTTYRKKGLMWDRYCASYGKDDSDDLVWVAESRRMNSSLSAAEIEREIASDPVKNRAEYLSTWRDDISGFMPQNVLEAATDWGVTQRPWSKNYDDKYCAMVDQAAGAHQANDSFAMSIMRGGLDAQVYQDRLMEFVPPFDPAKVVAELVEVLRSYNITSVVGDSAGWAASEFTRHGIQYFPAKPKSELYISCLPMMVSGRLRLLDIPKLRRQFSALERTVRAGGRESVEEPLRAGSHDDLANVTAGAAVVMAEMLSRNPAAVTSDFVGAFPGPLSGFPGNGGFGSNAEDRAWFAAGGRRPGASGNGAVRGLLW